MFGTDDGRQGVQQQQNFYEMSTKSSACSFQAANNGMKDEARGQYGGSQQSKEPINGYDKYEKQDDEHLTE